MSRYCDFNSHRARPEVPAQYVVACSMILIGIWHEHKGVVQTVVSGRYPSLFRPTVFSRLLQGINQRAIANNAEITLEIALAQQAANFAGFAPQA